MNCDVVEVTIEHGEVVVILDLIEIGDQDYRERFYRAHLYKLDSPVLRLYYSDSSTDYLLFERQPFVPEESP